MKVDAVIEEYEAKCAKVTAQWERGIITEAERKEMMVLLWSEATEALKEA